MRVLALAYVYPPDAGSGTYRSLYLLNRVAALGDHVTVVTARCEDFAESALVDRELVSRIDPTIRVVRAPVRRPLEALLRLRTRFRGALHRNDGASLQSAAAGAASVPRANRAACEAPCSGRLAQGLADTISAVLTFPDEHVGWIPGALAAAGSVVREHGADCVYASGGPWTTHLAAWLVHRRLGLPLVLDYRDPWASNPDAAGGRGLRQATVRRLERACVRAATSVVANTEALRQDFVRRYPDEPQAKFVTITNGYEPLPPAPAPRNERFTLVHAGEIYLSRNPVPLLEALRTLVREHGVDPRTLRVRLVGGCRVSERMATLLATEELAGVVEITQRVPHRTALELQVQADALLILQMGFPLQVPRKLFEYMAMRRPVLAIADPESATATVVRDSGVGETVCDEPAAITAVLLRLYAAWRDGHPYAVDELRIARFRNDALGQKLRDVLAASAERAGADLREVHS